MPDRLRTILRALVDDPFTKLASLLIAFCAWVWVQYQETDRGLVRVDVDYVLPDALVNTNALTTSVIATVEGPRVAIRRARTQRGELELDLRSEQVGPVDRVLDPTQVQGLPASVRILGFNVDDVSVVLDEKLSRRVSVQPQFVGREAEHHRVVRTVLRPDVVEVEGARSFLDGLLEVRTMPIDRSGWTADAEVPVELALPRGIRPVQPWQGTASVTVESLLVQQRFDDVRVHVLTAGWVPAGGFDRLSVQVEGPGDAVRRIKPAEVLALVELPTPALGEGFTAVYGASQPPSYRLLLPPDVRVVVTPPPIQVERP